jgi:hypothetical protein
MRKTTFAAITAGSIILAGFAGWATPSNRQLQAKASAAIEAQIDTFGMMTRAKDLPNEEFQDFSLVFSSPARGRKLTHTGNVRVLIELTTAASRT